ncbi:hypothetical protein BRADI_1g14927v3 [Brachypodium distachyon]|uniref:Uncharacterized protein n=1 Tax=Brachypodium distachyon TaxID=15368 RepID=A0A2K2DJK4_BRADI|nr:hypothetical protein BRADI_1g14927v3 [Brachypodium distachyon]
MYTRLRMSFWKQDPPNPTLADRNRGPMRESLPMDCATSAEEVAPAAAPDHVVQAGLIDGEPIAVPPADARLRDIHRHHRHVRALERDRRHRRTAHIPYFSPRHPNMACYPSLPKGTREANCPLSTSSASCAAGPRRLPCPVRRDGGRRRPPPSNPATCAASPASPTVGVAPRPELLTERRPEALPPPLPRLPNLAAQIEGGDGRRRHSAPLLAPSPRQTRRSSSTALMAAAAA